ncbi:helix-turn-helix domain-containing protein [Caballeronia cordobensis]|uniref:DNA-binding protein n=1 Tax=Caballeronia cordobensis TaxID=1353886 RepID=A0A158GSZ8_CABCO|nr:XRE family transcriptional regulator [Caballeronia cordobensis]AET92400.1 DNA-binding protein [Burkholderia sp. YI23]BAO90570.1 DNA-binding protein [Burkholderia sp. RPE67]SAL35218.1 DNA-binding protein [Caballeronia cordobensis]
MVAVRLKLLRKQLGMSLQELADRSEMTKSYLSKVERGLSTPSIAAAMKLAQALHIDVNELFSVAGGEEAISVVRASERVEVGGDGDESQPKYEIISPKGGHRGLVPFMITPAADFVATDFKEHEGEEFLFVHRGKIEIDFADHKVALSTGDSVHFNARIPHRIRSVGATRAQVLLVVKGEPTDGDADA